MKKFNYFLLSSAIFFCTFFQANAYTNQYTLEKVDFLKQSLDLEIKSSTASSKLDINHRQLLKPKKTDLITDNLTLMYSICVALVLLNLIALLKIIYQMIYLYYQFQKKDDFARLDF